MRILILNMLSGGSIGKILMLVGIVLFVLGVIVLLAERFNINLFRLPGDIVIRKENFTFYFPIVTGILLSVIITLVIYIINKLN